jgi:hypothetical protein
MSKVSGASKSRESFPQEWPFMVSEALIDIKTPNATPERFE